MTSRSAGLHRRRVEAIEAAITHRQGHRLCSIIIQHINTGIGECGYTGIGECGYISGGDVEEASPEPTLKSKKKKQKCIEEVPEPTSWKSRKKCRNNTKKT